MVTLAECTEKYGCHITKVVELVKLYLHKLRLEHWDVDIYIADDDDLDRVDEMASVSINPMRQIVALHINIEKHMDNTLLLMEEELKLTIKHELIHVMMNNMDKITDNYLSDKIYEIYNEFEEMVVDRLSELID